MPRRLLNLLTACCLLLFVAAGVLWVRSLSTSDGLLLTSPDGNLWWAICREGRVGVLTVRAWPYPIPPRYTSVPFAAAHVGPWMDLPDDWLASGHEPVGGILTVRRATATAQIESDPNAWSNFGRWRVRRSTLGRPLRRYQIIEAPLLPGLMLPAAVPTLWAVLGLRRYVLQRRRFSRGLCTRCGYDLRATPGRCPECGAPVLAGTGPDRLDHRDRIRPRRPATPVL